jgi:DNA-binding NarL/FixJ family response regulator
VLVDLGLPDMSGVAVIRAARARHPKAPIMVVSVLGGSENVLAAIRAGARGYLHKADSVMSLAEAIKRVLAGEHPISASLARYLFNLVQSDAPTPGERGTLSPRELQLLRLLSQGYTTQEAAERMGVGLSTAQTFCRRIYQKLQVHSKVKALLAARERGLL